MNEPVIPERWHIEQPRDFPYEGTKFPWRIVNEKGDSISLVGEHLASLMASAPELAVKLAAAETKVAELERQIAEPWKHTDHWRNPETGQVECECCCSWALDAEQQAATIKRMTTFLEAFVVAYKEPVEGPWFKLRAFAESQGIYADDLGRDRILLRIAQAALNGPVSK